MKNIEFATQGERPHLIGSEGSDGISVGYVGFA